MLFSKLLFSLLFFRVTGRPYRYARVDNLPDGIKEDYTVNRNVHCLLKAHLQRAPAYRLVDNSDGTKSCTLFKKVTHFYKDPQDGGRTFIYDRRINQICARPHSVAEITSKREGNSGLLFKTEGIRLNIEEIANYCTLVGIDIPNCDTSERAIEDVLSKCPAAYHQAYPEITIEELKKPKGYRKNQVCCSTARDKDVSRQKYICTDEWYDVDWII